MPKNTRELAALEADLHLKTEAAKLLVKGGYLALNPASDLDYTLQAMSDLDKAKLALALLESIRPVEGREQAVIRCAALVLTINKY